MTEANLSASSLKRTRSSDSRTQTESREGSTQPESDEGEKPAVPSFLTQTYGDLRKKFEELEWLQRSRVSSGFLSGDPSHKWALETSPKVRERNRYMSVQAWAHSRVHLKVPEGECDFINASPILLEDLETGQDAHYIATQGPKDGQLAHFWNMVYHETGEIAVIAMLTQTVEGGREKCAQYFPRDPNSPTLEFSSADSDPFIEQDENDKMNDHLYGTVTLLESSYDESLRSEISKFELRVGAESKIVWHYSFAGWSDFMKPEGADRQALLRLTSATAEKAGSLSNPRIVHCSAGVGRTGTFIALDHLLRGLKSGKLLEHDGGDSDIVFDTVNRLREQRMMMVYNDLQYQFIYELLTEQTRSLLGGGADEASESSRPHSAEASAQQSSESPFEPTPKPELQPITDARVSTPDRSWSATPEVSDNDPTA